MKLSKYGIAGGAILMVIVFVYGSLALREVLSVISPYDRIGGAIAGVVTFLLAYKAISLREN